MPGGPTGFSKFQQTEVWFETPPVQDAVTTSPERFNPESLDAPPLVPNPTIVPDVLNGGLWIVLIGVGEMPETGAASLSTATSATGNS